MDEKIEFIADGVSAYGPKVDGGYTIKLSVGGYEREKVGKLMALSQNQNYKVTIEKYGESRQPEPRGAKGNSANFPVVGKPEYPESVPGGASWPSTTSVDGGGKE